jgi:hypothetical protein
MKLNAQAAMWVLALAVQSCATVHRATPPSIVTTPLQPPPAPSQITIPLKLHDLDLRRVDETIPSVYGKTQVEAIPYWGTDQINFLIWREPIVPNLSGAHLSMTVHPYFFLSVGDAYDPEVQCGYRHERAQERLIGIDSTFDWSDTWSLKSQTTWQFLAINPPPDEPWVNADCRLGIIHYNATGKINTLIGKQLDRAAALIDQKVRTKTDVRLKADDLWHKVELTREITAAHLYVQLRPQSVYAGGIETTPTAVPLVSTVSSLVQLNLNPSITLTPPAPDNTPLPSLIGTTAGSPGFDLNLDVNVSFYQATAMIQTQFPLTVSYKEHSLIASDPVLTSHGSQVLLAIDVTSKVSRITEPVTNIWSALKFPFTTVYDAINDLLWTDVSQIYLVGTPKFDSSTRDIWFPDLEFNLESGNPLITSMDAVFHALAVRELRSATRMNFGTEIDQFYPALNAQFNQTVGNGQLSGFTNSVKPVEQVYVSSGQMLFRVKASGGINALDWNL